MWRNDHDDAVQQCQQLIKDSKSRIDNLDKMLQDLDQMVKKREVGLKKMRKTVEEVHSNVNAMKQFPVKRRFTETMDPHMFKHARTSPSPDLWCEENVTPNQRQTPPTPIGTPQYMTRFAPR